MVEPQVGMLISYHGETEHRIVEVVGDGDVKLDNGWEVDFNHCCEVISQPCPICFEYWGFHNDDKHRKDIDPKYLKEKGWHLVKS